MMSPFRAIAKIALALSLVGLAWVSCGLSVQAGTVSVTFLGNTPIDSSSLTGSTDGFDVSNPAGLYRADSYGNGGAINSEVLSGYGQYNGWYAYLYQIQAPSDTNVSSLSVGIPLGTSAVPSFSDPNGLGSSFYVSSFDNNSARSFGGFQTVGTIAPDSVEYSTTQSNVTFNYLNDGVSVDGVSYTIGLFSDLAPVKGNVSVWTGNGFVSVDPWVPGAQPTVATPEPSSLTLLTLLGIGLAGRAGYGRLRRKA